MARKDQKAEREKRAGEIAADVIEECRVQLMLKFRFLDLALWRMELTPVDMQARYALACNGDSVFFHPYKVLSRFEESFEEIARDYLHMVMHCIFRHPFDTGHKDREAWWLACDVMAESVCLDMCGGRFASEKDERRHALISELKVLIGTLLPGKLYELFHRAMTAPLGTTYQGLDNTKLNEIAALFERDNHEAWPAYASSNQQDVQSTSPQDLAQQGTDEDDEGDANSERDQQLTQDAEQAAGGGNGQDDSQGQSPDDGENNDENDPDSDETQDQRDAEDDETTGEGENSYDGPSSAPTQFSQMDEDNPDQRNEPENDESEQDWEEISKQIEMNLETFSKEWGNEAKSLVAALEVSNRKTYDYTDFLRHFSTISEDMVINDDEYDYIFYTFGLSLYGNMPLVEPLEYAETRRVRDFVIAIDTSESVKGDLVKRFVQHTFEILHESEGFHGGKVNIHVIQCDARVQSDQVITDLRDVNKFLDGFFVRGFGGTDFRPVFDYVEDLRNQGELADMQGLIYFTDGRGTFPATPPPYDAAFVFLETGQRHMPKVPPWAMRVMLSEEGISRLKNTGRFA